MYLLKFCFSNSMGTRPGKGRHWYRARFTSRNVSKVGLQ